MTNTPPSPSPPLFRSPYAYPFPKSKTVRMNTYISIADYNYIKSLRILPGTFTIASNILFRKLVNECKRRNLDGPLDYAAFEQCVLEFGGYDPNIGQPPESGAIVGADAGSTVVTSVDNGPSNNPMFTPILHGGTATLPNGQAVAPNVRRRTPRKDSSVANTPNLNPDIQGCARTGRAGRGDSGNKKDAKGKGGKKG